MSWRSSCWEGCFLLVKHGYCPGFLLVTVINTMTTNDLNRKGFDFSYSWQHVTEQSQGRNSRQKSEVEAMEGAAHWLALPAYLHNPGPPAQG